MVTTFWSVKGGVGVSTIAALWALASSESARATMLVDLCGDQPAVLGQDPPDGPGISEWCRTAEADAAALERIATAVTVDLAMIHRGRASWPETAAPLAGALATIDREVVVDAGRPDGFTDDLLHRSDQTLLVVRACYLNLLAASRCDRTPDGVVFVRERGRSLGMADVEAVTGAPVVATIDCDPAVARSIDAGLATTRVPRSLLRALARAQPTGGTTP